MTESTTKAKALVVGGSLAGLCAALALANAGWAVTVFERSSTFSPGMGLAVDMELFTSLTGIDGARVPTIDADYSFTGWSQLHRALLRESAEQPLISILTGVEVLSIHDDPWMGHVDVRTDSGVFSAALVVGADGYASVVRRTVAPERPTASYAGFVLWRGLIDETELARSVRVESGLEIEEAFANVLATFTIPGSDGSIRTGRRRIVYTWFDASATQQLRIAGRVRGDRVVGTWRAQGTLSPIVRDLSARALRWRSPLREAISKSVRNERFIGTPVSEYAPLRMAAGRLALVGDAAHVVSPVTGAGFHHALLDIQSLIRVLNALPGTVPGALRQYDVERLAHAQALVTESSRWSKSFVRRRSVKDDASFSR